MLHVTKGIKYKKPSNNPESLHKAKLELGALLKVHLHKMCQPDKQQLSKICQVSPINSQLITSPSFNCQCLIPKLETFKERWGWRDSRRHRKRAAIFMFSHTYIYICYFCVWQAHQKWHIKRDICSFVQSFWVFDTLLRTEELVPMRKLHSQMAKLMLTHA